MTDYSFKNWESKTDEELLQQIGKYIRYNRLTQNKTQSQIAKNSGISRSTLSLLERGETVNMNSFIQVLRTLDLLNLMEHFTVQKEPTPYEILEVQKNEKQRARNNDDDNILREPEIKWEW